MTRLMKVGTLVAVYIVVLATLAPKTASARPVLASQGTVYCPIDDGTITWCTWGSDMCQAQGIGFACAAFGIACGMSEAYGVGSCGYWWGDDPCAAGHPPEYTVGEKFTCEMVY